MSNIALVTVGNPNALTGGNLYNQRLRAALAESGVNASIVVLEKRQPSPALSSTVLIDSLALEEAVPVLEEGQAQCILVMHMLPSELAESEAARTRAEGFERRWILSAAWVIAACDLLGEKVVGLGADPRRLTIATPGSDGVPRLPHVESEIPRFLCVASWVPAKGISDAVEAVLATDNAELDLVGEQPDQAYAKVVKRSVGSSRRVRAHGPLQGRELAELFAAADAFLLASHSEAYGTVFAEALFVGLPIVAYDIPAVRVLAGPDGALLSGVADKKGLAIAVRRVADDRILRDSMALAARERGGRLPTWKESMNVAVASIVSVMEHQSQWIKSGRI
ncbi:MAG: glycosyltransferase family 4 protein [Chloroflexota bacterium]